MKTISPRFLPTVIGATVGGSLLEQDNDALGLSLGIGVGALTGYNFKVALPDANKLIYKDNLIQLPEVRLSAIDKHKQDLLGIVDTFTEEKFAGLPGTVGTEYDRTDMYGTLNKDNIRSAILDAKDTEELRRIKIAAMNPERFSLVGDPLTIGGDLIKKNEKHIINLGKDGENLDEAMDILRQKFSFIGYSGEELESKLVLFKSAIADVDRIILDDQTDNLVVSKGNENTVFKLSSSHQNASGMSSYMDTNNIYSVRSINPLAKQLVKDAQLAKNSVADTDGLELAKQLGIENPDKKTIDTLSGVHSDGLKVMNAMHLDAKKFSPEELRVLSKHLGENKLTGYKPEDLKALLFSSPLHDDHKEVFDTWLDSAYQHRQEESAYRALGYDRGYIENEVANDLTKRLSGQQDFGTSFKIDDKTGQIDLKDPLRGVNYKGSEGRKSEHREFLEMLREVLPGVDDGKKADHNNIASNGKRAYKAPYNINAPMERNPYTSSRDVRSENLGKNTIANTFDYLKSIGRVPEEYATAIASRRISVDESRFNRDILKFGGMLSGFNTVSDGGSIGSSQVLGNYNTKGMRTVRVSPDKDGILELSDKVSDLLRNRHSKDISENHTGLSVNKTLNKIEKSAHKTSELRKRVHELQNQGLPTPDLPDPKFNIQDPATWTERATNVALANRKYLANNPTANADPTLRPTAIEDARKKVEADYQRGVPFKQIGYESAMNNVDLAKESKDLEIAKLQKQLENIQVSTNKHLASISDTISSKIHTEGNSKYLSDLNQRVTSLAQNSMISSEDLHDLRSDITTFNTIADTTFKPGEVIGIDGNGDAVKLSKEFHEYKLTGTSFSSVDLNSGRMKSNFVFQGTSNVGNMGTIKTFAVDHKQNIAITDRQTYAYALAQSMFNSAFAEDFDTDGSLFGPVVKKDAQGNIRPTHSVSHIKKEYKEARKKGEALPEEAYFKQYVFRNRETGEKFTLTDEKISKKIEKTAKSILNDTQGRHSYSEIAVISSMDNNGQGIAQRVTDTLMMEDPDKVVDALVATKTVQNKDGTETVINTKNTLNRNIAETVSKLAKRGSTGYVAASEGWALGQMVQAFTENKASMNALLGMRLLGTNRLEKDLEIISPVVTKMSNPKSKNLLSSKEKAYLTDATRSVESLLGRGYITSKVQELTNNGQVSYSSSFGEVFKQEVLKDFDTRVLDLESNFSSAGNLAKFISEGGINEDTANLFRYAYTNYGESVMLASPDASQGYATGSGSLGKTMSHIAQTQLLAAGMSKETLSLFGELDQGSLYDYKALTTLDADMKGKPTLNTLLDSMVFDEDGNYSKAGYQRAQAFIKRLSVSDPDEVRGLLKEIHADENLVNELSKGEFLRFELEPNKHGMTNLPIYMENTARNSRYISEDDKVTHKPLQKAQGELLEKAFQHHYAPHGSGPSANTVEGSVKKYVKVWTGMVGNMNNPMLKDVLARRTPNSSYMKVLATSSVKLGEMVEQSMDNSVNNPLKGRSFAGVSRQKAAQMIQEYYGNEFVISSKSVKEVYEQQSNKSNYYSVRSVDDFIDAKTGLIKVTTQEGDSVPLYTLLNREPAHSSFSISPYELMVLSDREIGYSKSSLDSIFVHEKDMHYEALMLGDFDNDHITMYSVYKQITKSQAKGLEDYTTKIASVRNDLIPLMKSLGVKGADATNNPNTTKHLGIYDVTKSMQVLEEKMGAYKPKGMTVEEFRNSDAYWDAVSEIANERRGDASVKGGVRKTLSAPVVQLSVHLSNAIHTSSKLNQDFLTHAVAKTLSHALVENIIKTQHISTEEFANKTQLDVENIFRLRKELAEGNPNAKTEEYRSRLKTFFSDMVSVARTDDKRGKDVLALEAKLKANGTDFDKIVDEIIETDIRNIKDPRYAPTSILEYAKIAAHVTQEDFNARLLAEGSRDMGSKVHGDQLSLLDYEAEEGPTNVRKSFNQGFDELLRVAKQNLSENQRTLMIGGALLGVGAVLSQKDPDFSASKSVRADTQAGTIAPAMTSNMQARDNDAALQSQGRDKTEYIRPGKGMDRVKQNYSVNTSYRGEEGREAVGAKEAIFGKNITNVNINSNNQY